MDSGLTVSVSDDRWRLPLAAQKMMALTDENRLLISEPDKTNPVVLSFIHRLRAAGIELTIEYTSASNISKVYESPNKFRKGDDGERINDEDLQKMRSSITDLLHDAAKVRATDVSIDVKKVKARVKYRVNGDLYDVAEHPYEWGIGMARAIIQGICENVSSSHFSTAQSVDAKVDKTKISLPENVHEIRVSTMPTTDKEFELYFRFHWQMQEIPTLETLGFSEKESKTLYELSQQQSGLIAFVAPTNSGKTTAIYALLNHIFESTKGRKRIHTLEEPVELVINDYTQVSIISSDNEDRKRKYQHAVRALMRCDPDVIFVGETRDAETTEAVLDLTSTGHLVLTSVHAKRPEDLLSRLVGLNANQEILSSPGTLLAAVTTRLVPTLCPSCCVSSDDVKDELKDQAKELETKFGNGIRFRGYGCPECHRFGTVGRSLISEVMTFNPLLIEALLKKNYQLASLINQQRKHKTLQQRAIELIKTGVIDAIEAASVVNGFGDDDNLAENVASAPKESLGS